MVIFVIWVVGKKAARNLPVHKIKSKPSKVINKKNDGKQFF
jgi:hypothetical protein